MSYDVSYNYEKERQEAIRAGERALNSLSSAFFELKSARNWGLFDLIGGGFISTLIKQSKMGKAQSFMEQARYDLRNFSRELKDVEGHIDLDINLNDFLSFADFFFDGLIADWMVQSKINHARSQVEEAIHRVEQVLERLKKDE